MMHKLLKVSPKRAGIMWCLGIVVFGAIGTGILFTLPVTLVCIYIFDIKNPSWTGLRIMQVVQIPIIYLLGWCINRWYFPRTYTFNIVDALTQVLKYRFIPILAIGLMASINGIIAYGGKIQGVDIIIAICVFFFIWFWDGIWCFWTCERSYRSTYKLG